MSDANERIAQYLPLCRAMARRYSRATAGFQDVADLYAIAMKAVWDSQRNWTEDGGASFGFYVKNQIRWTLKQQRIKANLERRGRDVPKFSFDNDENPAIVATPEPSALELLIRSIRNHNLHAALATLPKRMQEVIYLRYFSDETFEEIGARLGVTKQRIQQIEAEALGLLRPRLGLMGEKGDG